MNPDKNPKPPTVGPRSPAGDSGARSRVEQILAEAGTFAPRERGPMNQSVEIQSYRTPPRSWMHSLLCRLGIHAWQTTVRSKPSGFVQVRTEVTRCAVCYTRRNRG